MAPINQDGSLPDSLVKETHLLGIGDTLMASSAFAIVEGVNTHAEIQGFEQQPGDVAVGIKMRYVALDTQYIIEPVYFIRDMYATSIAASSHDNKAKIAVTKIIPEENKFEFVLEQKLNKYIIMKAIKFPFINLLWLGIVVMTVGIYISMKKRLSDNRRKYADA
jgi:cytochrome c-type biogenesis protein CcmF